MTELIKLQEQFIHVIKGNDPVNFANQIVTQGSVNTLTRIGIYQNAYYLRLKECIETDHEILGYYLGDDLFDEMVLGFIKAHPSQYTSLRNFCDQLPEFLAQTMPFKEHPIIAELARFERHLLTAFDAADAKTINMENLKQIPPENWPELTFRLHPSVQRFKANYNSIETWQSLKQQQSPPQPEATKNNWLIWRNHERLTEFISLTMSEYSMLEWMISGHNYAYICEQLTELLPEDEVSQSSVTSLVNWINRDIIRSFSEDQKNQYL